MVQKDIFLYIAVIFLDFLSLLSAAGLPLFFIWTSPTLSGPPVIVVSQKNPEPDNDDVLLSGPDVTVVAVCLHPTDSLPEAAMFCTSSPDEKFPYICQASCWETGFISCITNTCMEKELPWKLFAMRRRAKKESLKYCFKGNTR